MTYNFAKLKQNIDNTNEWLLKEYATVRTGRATPHVLDGVRVESYGVMVPINQVATVGVEDARTLRIVAFDRGSVKEIEKAIVKADLGLSASSDDKGVRVSFPELTSENRQALIKVIKDKLEQARVSLRKERDETWNDIQKQEKDGTMSEDDKFRFKNEMQKLVDEGTHALDVVAAKKEKELSG